MSRVHVVDGWRIDVTVRPGAKRVISGPAIARIVAAALVAAGAPRPAGLSVLLTDDAELAELNETHLGHLGPTDVLSFPLLPAAAFPPHEGASQRDGASTSPVPFALPPGMPVQLGDIAVSVERAIAQATEGRGGQTGNVRWGVASEMRLLLTHGAFHVCGWDHAEPAEEAAMRALERALLGSVPALERPSHRDTPA